jgi:hypothetical protein
LKGEVVLVFAGLWGYEQLWMKNNYILPPETAIAWRRNWEADLAEANPKNYVRSFRIDREGLEAILAVPGMTAMRAYLGREERGGQDRVILVAVDGDDADIVNNGAGPFFDRINLCPPYCLPSTSVWW